MAGTIKPPALCALCGVSEAEDPTVASTVTSSGREWPPMCSSCSAKAVRMLSTRKNDATVTAL